MVRIKDRFRGHPNGSQMRKELSKELREITDLNGKKRFSAIVGNVTYIDCTLRDLFKLQKVVEELGL